MCADDRTIADWNQITNYFTLLSKTSNRVQVQTIGQSTLGRTLIAAFITALFFVAGLQMICLGAVAEYIGRIYDEVRKRPLSIINKVYRAEAAYSVLDATEAADVMRAA